MDIVGNEYNFSETFFVDDDLLSIFAEAIVVVPSTTIIFPEAVFASWGMETSTTWRTLITDFESGKEQRRKVCAFPKRVLSLSYNTILSTMIPAFWQFYQHRNGAYLPFWFYFHIPREWYGEYVNRGDGSTITFDLPCKETELSSLVVYVDNTTTSVSLLSGGGEALSDRIQFSIAPVQGSVITADFRGKLRLWARFEADNLTDKYFKYMLYSMGIRIKELR